MKRHMGRGMLCLFSVVLLVCLLTTAALADIIVEPEDRFYDQHAGECEHLYRVWTVNSPDGWTALWESPVSSRQVETLPNGTSLSGNWQYTDASGETWVAVNADGMSSDGDYVIRGWVRTSQCAAVPDWLSFQEAHGAEYTGFDSAYATAFDDLEQVTLWKYPESGTVVDQVDAEWFRTNVTPERDLDTCWRDTQGRLWAYVGYCYGVRNTWLCLDDPAATDIAASPDILPVVTEYPAATTVPAPSRNVSMLAIGSVAAVTLVTALLLWFLAGRRTGRPRRREQGVA